MKLIVVFLLLLAAPIKEVELNVPKLLEQAQDGINVGCWSMYLNNMECEHVTGIIDACKRDASQDRPKAVILDRLVRGEGTLGAYSKERPYLDWLIKLLY